MEYCISIDKIPHSYYEEILNNEQQIHEWNKLLCLNLDSSLLGLDFLKTNPFLPIDTKYFSKKFKEILHAENIIKNIEGIVINGNNKDVLESDTFISLKKKYNPTITCLYTDPPYNRDGVDKLSHKDDYSESEWLKMQQSNISHLQTLNSSTNSSFTFFISLDDSQYVNMVQLIQDKYGKESLFGPIIVQVNKGGRDYLPLAKTHEYIICGEIHGNKKAFNEIKRISKNTQHLDSSGAFEVRGLRNRNPRFNRENRPNLFYPFYINPNSEDDRSDDYEFFRVSHERTEEFCIEVFPKNSKRIDDCWRWGKEKSQRNINSENTDLSNVVARPKKRGKGKDLTLGANWRILEKSRKETAKPKSIWIDSSMRTENGTIHLRKLFGKRMFNHPKPVELVEKCITIGSNQGDWIIDYYAGSGTTGHAVLNLNQQSQNLEKKRKYILIELSSEHFNEIIIPRLKKVMFSSEWKNGKPISKKGISHIFTYLLSN